jgi:hypothetical protein
LTARTQNHIGMEAKRCAPATAPLLFAFTWHRTAGRTWPFRHEIWDKGTQAAAWAVSAPVVTLAATAHACGWPLLNWVIWYIEAPSSPPGWLSDDVTRNSSQDLIKLLWISSDGAREWKAIPLGRVSDGFESQRARPTFCFVGCWSTRREQQWRPSIALCSQKHSFQKRPPLDSGEKTRFPFFSFLLTALNLWLFRFCLMRILRWAYQSTGGEAFWHAMSTPLSEHCRGQIDGHGFYILYIGSLWIGDP